MAAITSIRRQGNKLLATYDDGSARFYTPTSSGTYLPMAHKANPVVPQGAGDTGVNNSGTPNPNAPGSTTAPIDDYPWPNAPENAFSPLRYSYRDCTDFIAWRINRDNSCLHAPWQWTWGNLRYQNGDAIGWKSDWQHFGRGVDITPVAGCIAWFGTSAGPYGHVAYVQSVSGGNMHLEEYNWGGTQAYNERTIPIPSVDSSHSFLAIPH